MFVVGFSSELEPGSAPEVSQFEKSDVDVIVPAGVGLATPRMKS
jgi:hypothetical protein